ncbi:hypothetical protein Bsp3421_001296 [Burkholderia sp. FERM BP-3421]|jgi:hypothetical protein|uniref:hypothetical protein n=1 Tax=Burkholderia sp. FERM BP-3421 TaxID=1494466 RepID=UPI00235F1FAC|nr:hypothetical protein [Burkholderia sp. FERM BP-3421]WDD91385.1 hypothetical protein Bsp3421_001296 [Burkholderia sp. FERM BP-3421]
MTMRAACLRAAAALALALAGPAAGAAAPLVIEGVTPRASGATAETLVRDFRLDADGALQFRLGARPVRIAPWPARLPKRLDPQYAAAWSITHPAGPMRVVTLRDTHDDAPWLRLTAGGGEHATLLPGTQVGRIKRGFVYLLMHDAPLRVEPDQPVRLTDEVAHRCWQFVLLGTSVPGGGAQVEAEPRADWYVRRVECAP